VKLLVMLLMIVTTPVYAYVESVSTVQRQRSGSPVRTAANVFDILCEVTVENIRPNEKWDIRGHAAATNNLKGNVGWTVNLWVCPEYADCKMIGSNGGRNITPSNHHDFVVKTGLYEWGNMVPPVAEVRITGRAYSSKIKGTLKLDGCGLDVLRYYE